MAVIVDKATKEPEEIWRVGRWAFVWLLRQAMASSADEPSRRAFERAIALDGLHLHLLDEREAACAKAILLDVAARGAAGELPPVEVEDRVLDNVSQAQFQRAANELVALLKRGSTSSET